MQWTLKNRKYAEIIIYMCVCVCVCVWRCLLNFDYGGTGVKFFKQNFAVVAFSDK